MPPPPDSPSVFLLLVALALLVGGCAPDAPGESGEGASPDATAEVLRIGYLVPLSLGEFDALYGAELGAEEASRAGELVGRRFELLTDRAATPQSTMRAASRMIDEGVFALVGGHDLETCRALGQIAEQAGILYFNVGCREDALRDASRLRNTFHVEGSETMYQALLSGAPEEAGAIPALWHPGLFRYGARQLNDRFESRFDRGLHSGGWAGWMAVKTLWEAALRTGSTDAEELIRYLESDSAGFDGHKGEPLRFLADSHQLRQPLYRVTAGAGSTEVAETREPSTAASESASAPPADVLPGEGRLAFVTNEGSQDVSIVELSTGRTLRTLPVDGRPRGVRISPDGARVYVAVSDHAPTAESDRDAVVVIDAATGRRLARHAVGSDPEQFAVDPDGHRLYASNEDAGTASITDLESGRIIATLPVGIEPEGVAVSPDGRWVYVTAETSNTVSVIDTQRNEVVASFLVDVRPRAAAFSPDGARAYVSNEISGTLSVVDAREHRVVETVMLAEGRAKPVGVAVSPDGARVYVANGHANSVSVLDASTYEVLADISVGERPWGVAVSSDGAQVYTANGGSNDISVIDAATHRVVGTIPVGERPWGVVVTPEPRR